MANVMSTLHPKWNTIGIVLVIIGLVLHLRGSFIGYDNREIFTINSLLFSVES
jgi:hypothetical protein